MSVNRLLLCTDLDRTLIPNGNEPESPSARENFSLLAAHEKVTLAYVTGRHQQLVEQAIQQYQLPRPDYVIADVGSTIYRFDSAGWSFQQDWEKLISSDWQGKTASQLHALFKGIDNLQLQEESKQNTHKLSYYVPLQLDHRHIISIMKKRLNHQSIAANMIWSIDEPENIGLLDVLPASAGKLQAIEFLMDQLGYNFAETVFAGDSGNDIDVLCSPINSVLVANADQQVRQMAIEQAKSNHQQQSLYLARGGFMQMNGNYSAGILEGVAYYIPHTELWMRGTV